MISWIRGGTRASAREDARAAPLGAIEAAALIVALGVGFMLGHTFVARPWAVSGESMSPSLLPGDRVVLDVWTLRRRAPRPGEIVLIDGPDGAPGPLVKRVSALPPGRSARPRHGPWPGSSTERPGVWVLGDHGAVSRDSRSFGAVPLDRIRGRVVWRYWPPARAGRVRRRPQ
ncbi:MAG: hypothetical protein GY716_13325 [bacterium]|nr:hypothetical protein [bacterium]